VRNLNSIGEWRSGRIADQTHLKYLREPSALGIISIVLRRKEHQLVVLSQKIL
jgi:hypothetical protein